jgi:hypothetical protein
MRTTSCRLPPEGPNLTTLTERQMTKQPGSTSSSAVQAVFDEFISRLRAETSINSAAIAQIETALSCGQYSADKLRAALLTEESL